MVLTEFPDITWLRKTARENFSAGKDYRGNPLEHNGWPSVILHVQTTQAERNDIKGPFSFFLNLSGSSEVRLDNRRFSISGEVYCLSNNEQHYSLRIPDSHHKTETFNIHFGERLFSEVCHLLQHTVEWTLDNPHYHAGSAYEILPKTNFLDATLRHKIHNLQRLVGQDNGRSPEMEFEVLAEILEKILLDQDARLNRSENITASKHSTRLELYKRVNIGLDFMHTTPFEQIALNTISKVCGMSQYHFSRTFKEIYGLSPMRYLSKLQIQRAQNLVRNKDISLSEIAIKLGFSELSAFTRFYTQRTGVSPTADRQKLASSVKRAYPGHSTFANK